MTLRLIGLGWFGLVAAKTYLDLSPSAKVIILDSSSTIGGVWAEHRVYPGLKSNNLLGTYEYSDFPMDEETFNVQRGQHIPGQAIHDYLQKYAEAFDLFRRIRFNSKVVVAEKHGDEGWLLMIREEKCNEIDRKLLARKVIIATGLTSEPFLAQLDGIAKFDAPLFHCKDFAQHTDSLISSKNVVVYGGGKSGWDMAYTYASAGVKVDWVIRDSGRGPAWMSPPYVTPLKKWLEKLVHTRFLTWFSPCIWGDADGYSGIRRFLQGTFIGRWIVRSFWWILANDVLSLNNYDAHPTTAKLKPWTNIFFTGSSASILNYPTDFFDFVRDGQIKVHIAEITHLSGGTVHLATGEHLETDTLVCCTGWKYSPPIVFHPPGSEISLGLPHVSHDDLGSQISDADVIILERFPILKDQPTPQEPTVESRRVESAFKQSVNQPFRLYRFMVPPSNIESHNIGFAGMLLNFSTPLVAQTQALWLAAYLDGHLRINKTQEEIMKETILHSQFGKWRCSQGSGSRFPDFAFDALPYLDLLLGDLGLERHRKRWWWEEWFQAYGPEDYKHLVLEWKRRLASNRTFTENQKE